MQSGGFAVKREYAEACPPLLKDFLYYMETIRGRSPRTVDGYFIDLRTFLRYIKAVKVLGLRKFDLSEITIDDLDSSVICGVTLSDIYGYLNFTLTERDNSAVTRARKVSSIRSFYKYITTKTDLLEVSPAKELDPPGYPEQPSQISQPGRVAGSASDRGCCPESPGFLYDHLPHQLRNAGFRAGGPQSL